MKEVQNNEQVYKKLSRLVAERYLTTNSSEHVTYGPLEINYFSICFGVNVIGQADLRGIYVKIPKAHLCIEKEREIMPLTDADKEFAQNEYQSLLHLSRFWKSNDINVTFVKPLGFIEEYNAIVTERVYAGDLFGKFRQCDLVGRLRANNHENPMHSILLRIGKALARFHKNSIKESIFKSDKTLTKIEYYCSQLKSLGIEPNFQYSIFDKIKVLKGYVASTQCTNTLKGLDIRNILIDKGERICMLDPGKMKEDCVEADLARFIVTCRILYWGSIVFFLRFCPAKSYEDSFLYGYYGCKQRPGKILIILVIKELFKHWSMAHTILQLKRWPITLKSFLRKAYIDPFYKSQITMEMANLERQNGL